MADLETDRLARLADRPGAELDELPQRGLAPLPGRDLARRGPPDRGVLRPRGRALATWTCSRITCATQGVRRSRGAADDPPVRPDQGHHPRPGRPQPRASTRTSTSTPRRSSSRSAARRRWSSPSALSGPTRTTCCSRSPRRTSESPAPPAWSTSRSCRLPEARRVDLDDLAAVVKAARADGLRPRACYVMPDFANPSGLSLDLETRRRLLEVAAEQDLLLLEDNPYGLFPAAGVDRLPTLKSLDTERRVIYLGSFAKTASARRPGRVRRRRPDCRAPDGTIGLLADELSKIKSMVTVNTSAVAQAVIGGKLLENDFSLVAANQREREMYAANLARCHRRPGRPLPRRRGHLDGPVRRVLHRRHGPVRGRRRTAGEVGPRVRRAVDADGPLLRRRRPDPRPPAVLQLGHPGPDRRRPEPPGRPDRGPALTVTGPLRRCGTGSVGDTGSLLRVNVMTSRLRDPTVQLRRSSAWSPASSGGCW